MDRKFADNCGRGPVVAFDISMTDITHESIFDPDEPTEILLKAFFQRPQLSGSRLAVKTYRINTDSKQHLK